jgi:hypothetical protein
MLSSIFIAYLVCLISILIASTTALPHSRFSHHTQTLNYRNARRTPFLESRTSRLLHYLEPRSTSLQKRGLPGAVYICTDQNFRGDCSWIAPNSQCHIIGTGEFGPESIGPDPDGHCILFEKATCTGNQIETLKFPGRATGMPAFMGLMCFADVQGPTGNSSTVQNGTMAASGRLWEADPRLAGGAGSLDAKQLKSVLGDMEKDGFKEGMKKGHYY